MGQINAFIQKQQDSAGFIKELKEEKKEELNQKKKGNINIQTMILYDNFFSGTQIYKKRQDTIISEISVKADEKRKEVINAMQKRRTLEILKDREILEEKKQTEKKLIAIDDENASNLWARKQ